MNTVQGRKELFRRNLGGWEYYGIQVFRYLERELS